MVTTVPKGFRHMQVSAYFAVFIVVVPLLISICDLKGLFVFAWSPFISEWSQYWRLVGLQAQFQNQSEVSLGVVFVAFKLKALERYYGSVKYFKILVMLSTYNFICITILGFILHTLGINLFIPSGPFGIIFGLVYPYWTYVPTTYISQFDFSGLSSFKPLSEPIFIQLTDNFGFNILLLCLLLNEGISSVFPSIIGYFIGYLYFNNLVPFTDVSLDFMDNYIYSLIKEQNISSNPLSSVNNGNNNGNDNDNDNDALEIETDNITRDNSPDDTPVRPFGRQLLDTFRG